MSRQATTNFTIADLVINQTQDLEEWDQCVGHYTTVTLSMYEKNIKSVLFFRISVASLPSPRGSATPKVSCQSCVFSVKVLICI